MNRSQRCGVCRGCQAKPCGQCIYCQDSPQFGGPGVKKQSCIERRCLRVLENRLQRDAPTFKAKSGCNICDDCRTLDCQVCLVCLDKKFFENRHLPGAMCAKKRCNHARSIEISPPAPCYQNQNGPPNNPLSGQNGVQYSSQKQPGALLEGVYATIFDPNGVQIQGPSNNLKRQSQIAQGDDTSRKKRSVSGQSSHPQTVAISHQPILPHSPGPKLAPHPPSGATMYATSPANVGYATAAVATVVSVPIVGSLQATQQPLTGATYNFGTQSTLGTPVKLIASGSTNAQINHNNNNVLTTTLLSPVLTHSQHVITTTNATVVCSSQLSCNGTSNGQEKSTTINNAMTNNVSVTTSSNVDGSPSWHIFGRQDEVSDRDQFIPPSLSGKHAVVLQPL